MRVQDGIPTVDLEITATSGEQQFVYYTPGVKVYCSKVTPGRKCTFITMNNDEIEVVLFPGTTIPLCSRACKFESSVTSGEQLVIYNSKLTESYPVSPGQSAYLVQHCTRKNNQNKLDTHHVHIHDTQLVVGKVYKLELKNHDTDWFTIIEPHDYTGIEIVSVIEGPLDECEQLPTPTPTQTQTQTPSVTPTQTQTPSVTPPVWSPSDIDTSGGVLHTWYDAADTSTITTSNGGNDVTLMTDKSSNNFDLSVITANRIGPNSGTRTLNGLNVLEYSKTSTTSNVILEHNGFNQNQPIVLTMLVHLDNEGITEGEQDFLISFTEQLNPRLSIRRTTSDAFQVLSNAGSIGSVNGSATEPGEYLVTVYFNSTNSSLRVNGSFINSGTIANNTLVNINLGGEFNENQCLDGFIAETILYSDNTDIVKVEGYLAHKWGVSSLLPDDHQYKLTPPSN